MFCPKCGKTVSEGLKYCNGCGERLAREIDKGATPDKMLNNILTTLVLIVFFGFGILIGLVAVLLSNAVKTDAVAALALVYLIVLFGICFTLIRQIPKLIDAKLSAWKNGVDILPPQHFQPQTIPQLDEYREPVMSVTDHTTKTLDKIPLAER